MAKWVVYLSRRLSLLERIALGSPLLFVFTVGLLGFITPDYDHLSATVSRLAIEKFGIFQEINLLQLTLGLLASGYVIGHAFSNRASRRRIYAIFSYVASIIIMLTIFTTAPFTMINVREGTVPPQAIMHFVFVGIFFFSAPLGIRVLYKIFLSEPNTRHLARFTLIVGLLVCALSTILVVFFTLQWFSAYYGIFQKGIILICIYWLLTIVTSVRKL